MIRQELEQLNGVIDEWMGGDDTHAPSEIIGKAADLYANRKDELPQSLKEVFEDCLNYTKTEKPSDVDEYILVEELSGFIGEYLA